MVVDMRKTDTPVSLAGQIEIEIPEAYGLDGSAVCDFAGVLRHDSGLHILSGRGNAVLRGLCAVCLADVEIPLDFEVEQVYAVPERVRPDEDDISITDTQVDIAPAIGSALFLTIPMRVVCKADCNGLCPRCGINRNYFVCDCDDNVNEDFAEMLKGISFD